MDDLETPVQLSHVTVAYAAMFYVAAAILLVGLVAKIWKSLRRRTPLKASMTPSTESPIGSTIRLASEVMLFRSTFFTDRWNWIFGTCFHFGLLLVLLRHLRYGLDPSWVGGTLWQVVTIVQPFGFYGGLALIGGVLGFSLRRVLFKEVRQNTGLVDALLLVLLLAVPVTGYLSVFVHTDIVAVKDFFVGLVTGNIKQLPTDFLLLIHLWLVATLMVALPFGKMLHFADIFQTIAKASPVESGRVKRTKLAVGVVLALLLAVPAVVAGVQISADGWTAPLPDYAKLIRSHRGDDPTVMIRNHPNFLMHKQTAVIYDGVRKTDETIERCVSCHVKKDASGQPVDFENPKHFCTACHTKAAVTMDCFECHNSKPAPVRQSALEPATRFASIKDFFSKGAPRDE
ncbi:respiratory nitrate reductase subunit gamma [Telmatospirillum sp.]|uniref:respiratory nitrate reductase subunit gamma n=1 Tax=Telmatospirillum sp. TaxID=2079197 RepID=UPI00283E120F|nr:respiratory nitrate reductase subunit gamma [Telmatospirillum sp.]MDR3437122.1 respiratory nitrate reductase subunit gamma [Telmatospirillum sp.]